MRLRHSIAGRGVVMTRNYRNTREIATFAASLVGDSGFVDIESGPRGRMDAAEVLREGAAQDSDPACRTSLIQLTSANPSLYIAKGLRRPRPVRFAAPRSPRTPGSRAPELLGSPLQAAAGSAH